MQQRLSPKTEYKRESLPTFFMAEKASNEMNFMSRNFYHETNLNF